VEQLRASWYDLYGRPPPAAGGAAAPAAAAAANGVCAHLACSGLPHCIVASLKEAKSTYAPGAPAVSFKLRALDKAARAVERHPAPLLAAADAEGVAGLGGSSLEKVKQIIYQGCTSRVAGMKADARHHCLLEFTRVWGCAAATAAAWYAAGCRSLADVAARAEGLRLTEAQRCGLRHVEAFSRRIPRREIAGVERALRARVFALVEGMGCPDAERTYCGVTGSYKRGQADSGDIDLLTCLPPSLGAAPDCAGFLRRLLTDLLADGFLTEDMDPAQERFEVRGAPCTAASTLRAAQPRSMRQLRARARRFLASPPLVTCPR
jgi:hypothetical protein